MFEKRKSIQTDQPLQYGLQNHLEDHCKQASTHNVLTHFPHQIAFIKGRSISENIILRGETFNTIKNKKSGRGSLGALKLDMDKAYDRLSWKFIRVVMESMGFNQHQVNFQECISTASFQLLINGTQSKCLKPIRELRQGDPLSPYIFILCQNILSVLLSEVEAQRKISGIKISRGNPHLSHLLFADDSLVFFRTNVQAYRTVKAVLNEYCMVSEQKINFNMLELFVSPNCNQQKMRWFSGILIINCVPKPSKYFGFELGAMKRKKQFFQFCLTSSAKDQQGGSLNSYHKEADLHSSNQHWQVFYFKASYFINNKIDQTIRSFQWGHDLETRKLHFKNWESICHSKGREGLGIRKTENLNKTLLGKQAWRLLTKPKNLLASIMTPQYCKNTPFIEIQLRAKDSWIWKCFFVRRDVCFKGLDIQIWSGKHAYIQNNTIKTSNKSHEDNLGKIIYPLLIHGTQ